MGKRITSQARGRGSLVYRVRKKGYRYRVKYPNSKGKAEIIKIIHSPAHSSPLIKMKIGSEIFYNVAFENAFEGQNINVGIVEKGKSPGKGDIIMLQDAIPGMSVYNIETKPGNGGKLIRAGGSSGEIIKKEVDKVKILMPSKKTADFNSHCMASVGIVAGTGRLEKPLVKAGKRFHAMKAKGRKWHFTSAVKTNAIDHPFGGGRGKRIKSKIAKRNSPPGAKVGHLSPRRTGRRKR